MVEYLIRFLVAFGAFLVIDLVWLGVVAKNLYQNQLGELMRPDTVWPAAILFYVLFLVGLIYFAINPAIEAQSLSLAVKNGALYGFFTYMTYELTNYAVIKDWPAALVVPDILWGTILAAAVSSATYWIVT